MEKIPEITEERLEEIKKYTWQDVNPTKFRNQESWGILRDIILHHPNPIVRHEASYISGDYNIIDLVPTMILAVKADKSIVAKHEAAEALGFIKGPTAKEAYNFLKDLVEHPENYDELTAHEDVIVTAKEALKLLEEEVKILDSLESQN